MFFLDETDSAVKFKFTTRSRVNKQSWQKKSRLERKFVEVMDYESDPLVNIKKCLKQIYFRSTFCVSMSAGGT